MPQIYQQEIASHRFPVVGADETAIANFMSFVHREVQKTGEGTLVTYFTYTPQLPALGMDGQVQLLKQYAVPTLSPCFIHMHPCNPLCMIPCLLRASVPDTT